MANLKKLKNNNQFLSILLCGNVRITSIPPTSMICNSKKQQHKTISGVQMSKPDIPPRLTSAVVFSNYIWIVFLLYCLNPTYHLAGWVFVRSEKRILQMGNVLCFCFENGAKHYFTEKGPKKFIIYYYSGRIPKCKLKMPPTHPVSRFILAAENNTKRLNDPKTKDLRSLRRF